MREDEGQSLIADNAEPETRETKFQIDIFMLTGEIRLENWKLNYSDFEWSWRLFLARQHGQREAFQREGLMGADWKTVCKNTFHH